MYIQTTALKKLLKLKKRIRGIQGGTSASKTISIEQILIDKAQVKYPKNKLISITSESMPHLKRGAMRDFLSIMEEHGYFDPIRWNKTDSIYTFETGNKIEFFSLDMPHKVRGPRRDILFINEANNIPKETFEQLEVRTMEEIWLDWNPTAPFWYHEDLEGRDDVDGLILTYKDNEGNPESIIKSIEARRNNKNWWRVYGEGQLGEVEGRVYTGWKLDLEDIPHEARLVRRGLDFGYSVDPAALVDVWYINDGYILDERLYQTGMRNQELAEFVKNLEEPQTLLIADSAEPKSIDEIKMYGLNVLPTTKGPGSVNQGINYVQSQKIQVTKRSVNLIKEFRSYMWKFDRDGRQLAIPEDINNHAMDAIRYAIQSLNVKTDVMPYKPKAMLQRKHSHA